jgi:hypothetical protein
MSRLKSTIKTHTDYGKGEGYNKGLGFVFSDNILEWIYGDSVLGRKRRKQYEFTKNLAHATASAIVNHGLTKN